MTWPALAEFERYDDSMDLVLSCSGGKDSVAVGIVLHKMGIPFRAVFADTGWEHASTYRYLREVVPDLIGREVVDVRTEITLEPDREALARVFEARLGFYSPMVRFILHWAMFPSRVSKWCTDRLKIYPIGRYLDTLEGEPVVLTGIRREESESRKDALAWETMRVDVTPPGLPRLHGDQLYWRPAVEWRYKPDVVGIFQAVGVAPADLYLAGANRLGCWPCINMGREELRLLATDKARASILRDLESVVATLAAERTEAQGRAAPSFFQAKNKDPKTGLYVCWPIDRVLRWAKGKPRNPDQQEIFTAPESGCARWGLCPASGPPKIGGE